MPKKAVAAVTLPAAPRSRKARDLVNTGMVAALGALTVTALIHKRPSRQIHTLSGVALLGLAWLHYRQNVKPKAKRKA